MVLSALPVSRRRHYRHTVEKTMALQNWQYWQGVLAGGLLRRVASCVFWRIGWLPHSLSVLTIQLHAPGARS
jgi:hypothetical protein